ncbi:MAG: hypothetical protein H6Q57_2148, partial [Geobacteraceae bacterium]|nr:hypothetical protein [Geobacteraceae bacterium]
EKRDGFVYRGDARRGESGPDFLINLVDTGVVIASGKDPDDCQTLRRHAEVPPLYFGQHLRQTLF